MGKQKKERNKKGAWEVVHGGGGEMGFIVISICMSTVAPASPPSPPSCTPQHGLNLVIRTLGARQNERVCVLCDSVEGLFYGCKLCDFDVHPLCTQLPQYVRHALHPDHQLSASGWCAVCKSVCSSWRYKCETCSSDIHLECMLLAPSNGASTSRSVPPRGPPPHFNGAAPPPPHGAHGYVVPPGFSPPYSNVSEAQGGSKPSKGRKLGKIMYALVGKLTIGVIANVLFGMADFSSSS